MANKNKATIITVKTKIPFFIVTSSWLDGVNVYSNKVIMTLRDQPYVRILAFPEEVYSFHL